MAQWRHRCVPPNPKEKYDSQLKHCPQMKIFFLFVTQNQHPDKNQSPSLWTYFRASASTITQHFRRPLMWASMVSVKIRLPFVNISKMNISVTLLSIIFGVKWPLAPNGQQCKWNVRSQHPSPPFQFHHLITTLANSSPILSWVTQTFPQT